MFGLHNFIGGVGFSEVEEDVLADAVVTTTKLLVAFEAEAQLVTFLHLRLGELHHLPPFDGDNSRSCPSRRSRER